MKESRGLCEGLYTWGLGDVELCDQGSGELGEGRGHASAGVVEG